MSDPKIVEAVQQYLSVLNEHGIPAERAILFGSRARGSGDEDRIRAAMGMPHCPQEA